MKAILILALLAAACAHQPKCGRVSIYQSDRDINAALARIRAKKDSILAGREYAELSGAQKVRFKAVESLEEEMSIEEGEACE